MRTDLRGPNLLARYLLPLLLAVPALSRLGAASDLLFDGTRAYRHLQNLVAIGVRAPGSVGHNRTVEYLTTHLKSLGLAPTLQTFEASTPRGRFSMTNVLVTLPATTAADRYVVLAAHYDTKIFDGFEFVGANDGGSGTAALLELARDLKQSAHRRYNVIFAFLDGEEAMREWSATDSLYGSRHLADVWERDGTLKRLQAFVLLDMVGSKTLSILKDGFSTPALQQQIWREAQRLHLSKYFAASGFRVEDDHIPFLRRGVPAVVLIDFTYGPNGSNTYWHTKDDTLDKVSAESLQVVGRVVEATVMDMP